MAAFVAPSLSACLILKPSCRCALFRQAMAEFPGFSRSESSVTALHVRLMPLRSCNAPAARGMSFRASWEAHTHLGSHQFTRGVLSGKKKKSSRWSAGTLVQASLFGVGAPEVLVIAVVALLVFGPKGLAEVARTLGKSLRAFQPTIRELQEVSRDFKQTLEKEIGFDELRSYDSQLSKSISTMNEQPQDSIKSNQSSELRAYPTEDLSKTTEEQAIAEAFIPEEQRQAAITAAWRGSPPAKVNGEIINNDAASRQDKPQDGPAASDRS